MYGTLSYILIAGTYIEISIRNYTQSMKSQQSIKTERSRRS